MSDFELNEKQLLAVTHPPGNLLVIAGPGSGKTQVISKRCLYLIENYKVPPEQILVITFTKDAAINMQHRFFQISDSKYYVNFGTFHSVFYHMLRESGDFSEKKLLSDSYSKKLLAKAMIEVLSGASDFNAKKDMNDKVESLALAISIYKNTLDFNKATKKLDASISNYFSDIFDCYEHIRLGKKMFGFDDMIYDLYCLFLNNSKVCGYWKSRFSHILIDEYQDINPIQYEVVKMLSSNNYIFAVGDDDQAIYSFRGSNRECVKRFYNEFNAKLITLDINYRSNAEIVSASQKVISEDKNRFDKNLSSVYSKNDFANEHSGGAMYIGFMNKDEQIKYIIEKINDFRLSRSLDTIAILFRTNAAMQSFAKILLDNGVKFNLKEMTACIYDTLVCKDLISYLRIINGQNNDKDLFRIINKPNRYISREALYKDGEVSLYNALDYYKNNKSMPFADNRIKEITLLIEDFKFVSSYSLILQIDYILNKMGLRKYYEKTYGFNKTEINKILEELDFLKNDSAKYNDLSSWIEYQNSFREELIDLAKGGRGSRTNDNTQNEEENMLSLMTIHASKGLEFDSVFIPDANEGTFPFGHMLTEEEISEERRIFYVGMTRAKKELFITYLKGTKDKAYVPSRFIN